jgi:hypothetical protein
MRRQRTTHYRPRASGWTRKYTPSDAVSPPSCDDNVSVINATMVRDVVPCLHSGTQQPTSSLPLAHAIIRLPPRAILVEMMLPGTIPGTKHPITDVARRHRRLQHHSNNFSGRLHRPGMCFSDYVTRKNIYSYCQECGNVQIFGNELTIQNCIHEEIQNKEFGGTSATIQFGTKATVFCDDTSCLVEIDRRFRRTLSSGGRP